MAISDGNKRAKLRNGVLDLDRRLSVIPLFALPLPLRVTPTPKSPLTQSYPNLPLAQRRRAKLSINRQYFYPSSF